jgi:hypothetical protein
MAIVSGFTFIHNAISGGYPLREAIEAVSPYVDEMVVVDMQSNDGTREWLDRLSDTGICNIPCSVDIPIRTFVRVIDGHWGSEAGETLRQAHNLHIECQGDVIIHFEADEVFDDNLIRVVRNAIDDGYEDIAIYRLQVSQNFNRCRWYPEPVHRIFPNHSGTRKEGHTTNRHSQAHVLPPDGWLWDCTNCFSGNYLGRVEAQAELWHHKETDYLMTGIHTLTDPHVPRELVHQKLNERHWQWTVTPFNIPERLKPLVGKKKYSLERLD